MIRSKRKNANSHPGSARPAAVTLRSTTPGEDVSSRAFTFTSSGFTLQRVVVAPSEGYDFTWQGGSHYLALHDLQNSDGETISEDGARVPCLDLRGRLSFIPAGCKAWGWCIPRVERQSFTAVYFDPGQIERELDRRLRGLERPRFYFKDLALRSTLEKLQHASQPNVQDPLYMESLCVAAAWELCFAHQDPERRSLRVAGGLSALQHKRVLDFLDANLAEDIGLQELAAIAGLSRYHFLRSFKQSTQLTPHQYLLRQRIERGQRLLEHTSMTVSEVAAQVGFRDATHFIRVFRKLLGTTPGDYRRRRANGSNLQPKQ